MKINYFLSPVTRLFKSKRRDDIFHKEDHNIRLTRIFFFQEILKKSIVKSKYKNQISVRDKASKHPKIIAIKIASFSTHFSLMNRKFPFNKILNGRPVRVQTHGKNTTMEEISVRGGSWWLERRGEKKKKKEKRKGAEDKDAG